MEEEKRGKTGTGLSLFNFPPSLRAALHIHLSIVAVQFAMPIPSIRIEYSVAI